MDNQHPSKETRRTIEYILFVLAGINCIIITAAFFYTEVALSGGIEAVFPFPGIYFIELIAIGIICLFTMLLLNDKTSSGWSTIAWICSGLLVAFVILGAWTIGFYLIPGMILLLVVGILIDRRTQRNYALHLIYFFAAALSQGIFVFIVI
jgi:hypothetical protein